MSWIDVRGARFSVALRGEGAAVLFIHGFPFDHTMWRHQVEALHGWTCIAPDLRGLGASQLGDAPATISTYADDLIAILDRLEVASAVICGLSMGGYVVLDLARRYGERVRAMVLADTRAEADTEEGRRARDEVTVLVRAKGQRVLVERLLPKLLAGSPVATPRPILAELARMIQAQPVPGLLAALQAMRDRTDSTAQLAEIRVPTLVIVGDRDQITPPSLAYDLAARIPGARCALVADAGHVPPLQQPDSTTQVLREFLESVA